MKLFVKYMKIFFDYIINYIYNKNKKLFSIFKFIMIV